MPERNARREQTVRVEKGAEGTRVIEFECARFIIEHETLTRPPQPILLCSKCHHSADVGLSAAECATRRALLGPNLIAFRTSSIFTLIKKEMCTGFYLYQAMMYQVWIWAGYLVVGILLASVVLISAAINIWLARNGEENIAKICQSSMDVKVKRSGEWTKVESAELVPGDIIQVEADWTAPADLALLRGSAVCDEAGLTGESMPVGKSALPDVHELFEASKYKSSMIWGGTKVLQVGTGPTSDNSSGNAMAVVVATGINTNKGELISAILFPVPMLFKYDEEFPLYFLVLFCYALLGFAMSAYFVDANGSNSHWVSKWTYGIFTCSQVLSPMLPVALVVGENMASRRLRANQIFCMDSKRIAIAGKIRVFCFDKTGTLTREGLDFLGVQEVAAGEGVEPAQMGAVMTHVAKGGEKMAMDSCGSHMRNLLATCHNLKNFGDKLVGNQVEVNMFGSCGGEMIEGGGMRTIAFSGGGGGKKLEIIKTFEFDHARMTMSVVVRTADGKYVVYCKGAPERVTELCTQESRPTDFTEVHRGHSLEGCYVLGAAMKELGSLTDQQLIDLTRDDVEKEGMQLLGLLCFRNEIKVDTANAIKDLQDGDVRCIMLTGDNAQCGAYIARESGMVAADQTIIFGDVEDGIVLWSTPGDEDIAADIKKIQSICRNAHQDPGDLFERVELAVTQKALDVLITNDEFDNIMLHIRIFARLRPDGKVAVIEKLWSRQLIVGMCGDGGNDCGALRVAHAGMALSDAEASVVSPFTSKDKSIRSVVDLLREGRAALASNFSSFKFLVTYGQLFSVLKLMAFQMGVVMCQMSYILIDVVGVLIMTYALTTCKPADKLPPKRPTSSLIGFTSLGSVAGAQVIHVSFLIGALCFVMADSEYVDWPGSSIDDFGDTWLLNDNWETDALYFGIYFPWIVTAITFSYGHIWRQPVWKNYYLMTTFVTLFAFNTYLLMSSKNTLTEAFHVSSIEFGGWDNDVWRNANKTAPPMKDHVRVQLWSVVVSSGLCATLWEKIFVLGPGKTFLKTPKHKRPDYVHLRI